jgi:hypothetical protein
MFILVLGAVTHKNLTGCKKVGLLEGVFKSSRTCREIPIDFFEKLLEALPLAIFGPLLLRCDP